VTQGSDPSKRPTDKPPKKHRPVLPSAPSPSLQPAQQDAAPPEFDDDLAIVPAPAPEVFARQKSTPSRRLASGYKSLGLRRTAVPLLLTWGLMLSALGGLWFTTGPDSPYRNTGMVLPAVLIGLGLVLFAAGILNALHIRHLLQTSKG
jgi:hypothetical protein